VAVPVIMVPTVWVPYCRAVPDCGWGAERSTDGRHCGRNPCSPLRSRHRFATGVRPCQLGEPRHRWCQGAIAL